MQDALEDLAPSRVAHPGSFTPDGGGQAVQQFDYFGFASTARFTFPDGVSWLDLKVLNEGERRRYQNESNREIKLGRSGGGDASLKMRPGDDKHLLLAMSITGWNLVKGGVPVPFNKNIVDQFLANADPSIIDKIEKRIRELNPWLLSEMSLEDIDEEIRNLEEMRNVKLREEEGKGTSSDR